MKTSKWIALAAAAITASGLLALNAAPAKAKAEVGGARGQLLQRAKEKLNLTDDQVAQIKSVLKDDKEVLRGLLLQMHEARSGLREAIRTNGATPESVRTASAKVAAVEADLAVERLKLYGKISPILTAEQREKLQQAEAQLDDMIESVINHLGRKRGD